MALKRTVLDYVKEYGGYSFLEKPMTEVDSLVLCQLSYLKFDGLVPEVGEDRRCVTLKSLAEHPDFDRMFADVRFEKVNRELFDAMLVGRRFSSLKLNCYVNVVDKKRETQFSAVTYILEDDSIYVAFRGTDESIVGWKESFNMAFLSPVPSQEYGVRYLNAVAGRLHRPFYVGGHSKGGNLAVYSAMNCSPNVRDRIIRIYNMDGPGFRPEVLKNSGYETIAGRVVKILPYSSLVGMIFEWDMHFQVVESKTFGLAQHDAYTWLVEGENLVRARDVCQRRKRMDNALNRWILSLDKRQLRNFVDTLYQVIAASQADDLIEFTEEWKRSINGMLSALRGIDKETMKMLKEVVKALFEIAGAQLRQDITKNVPAERGTQGIQSRPKLSLPRS